jgi:pimeloyl-ACP methyl ester carboxylesterase
LELKNVIIVGHSFGGRVGIKLASEHPELISKLVLVDSAGFASKATKKKFYRIIAKIVKPIFKPKTMQGLRRKIYQKIGAEDYLATPELQTTFVNIVTEDLTADMADIRLPTLVIWGRNDKDTPVRQGERMYATIFNSQLVILEHAGHFSFIDQPQRFAEVLKKFIK